MADGEAKSIYGPLDEDHDTEICLGCGCVISSIVKHHCVKDLKLDVFNALSCFKLRNYDDHKIIESILKTLDEELDQ